MLISQIKKEGGHVSNLKGKPRGGGWKIFPNIEKKKGGRFDSAETGAVSYVYLPKYIIKRKERGERKHYIILPFKNYTRRGKKGRKRE